MMNNLLLHTLTLMILSHDLMSSDLFFFLGKKHGQKYLCSWTWWVCAKHGRRPWKMVWRSSHLKAKRLHWMLGLESSSPWTLDMLAGQSYLTTWRLSFVLWQWLFPIYNKSVKLCCSLKGWSLPTSYTLFFLKLTVGLSCMLIYIYIYSCSSRGVYKWIGAGLRQPSY